MTSRWRRVLGLLTGDTWQQLENEQLKARIARQEQTIIDYMARYDEAKELVRELQDQLNTHRNQRVRAAVVNSDPSYDLPSIQRYNEGLRWVGDPQQPADQGD